VLAHVALAVNDTGPGFDLIDVWQPVLLSASAVQEPDIRSNGDRHKAVGGGFRCPENIPDRFPVQFHLFISLFSVFMGRPLPPRDGLWLDAAKRHLHLVLGFGFAHCLAFLEATVVALEPLEDDELRHADGEVAGKDEVFLVPIVAATMAPPITSEVKPFPNSLAVISRSVSLLISMIYLLVGPAAHGAVES
jgi:hypothetical protein